MVLTLPNAYPAPTEHQRCREPCSCVPPAQVTSCDPPPKPGWGPSSPIRATTRRLPVRADLTPRTGPPRPPRPPRAPSARAQGPSLRRRSHVETAPRSLGQTPGSETPAPRVTAVGSESAYTALRRSRWKALASPVSVIRKNKSERVASTGEGQPAGCLPCGPALAMPAMGVGEGGWRQGADSRRELTAGGRNHTLSAQEGAAWLIQAPH